MTDLRSRALPGDLAACEREPIHVPGAVQPHGVLLAVSEPDLVVRVASANCATWLGVRAEELLGRPVGDVVAGDLVPVDLAGPSSSSGASESYPISARLRVHGREVVADTVVHRSDGLLVVEMEPGTEPVTMHTAYRLSRTAAGRINGATEPDELYRIAVEEVRRLTAFDRVMVYRFDEDWNGEVVAEDRADGLNSFLGLHYPASDVPAQARALYRNNWLRLIADVDYEPVPLVPDVDPRTGQPLDLTHAALRSVSPIHIEYLRNMGVTASMSISLLDRGELWGLIACHHYSGPHRPPHDVRAAAEFLGQMLSLRLVEGTSQEELRQIALARSTLAALTAEVQDESRPAVTSLTQGPHSVLHLIPAGGAALFLEGREASVGAVPPPGVVRALVAHAAAGGHDVLALDRVPDVLPDLASAKDLACGALVLRLSDQQYVVWLRPELVQTVAWGGDPYNAAIAAAEGDGVRISPRKSFASWQETVSGRSEAWSAVDTELAGELRHDLIDALYGRSRRLASTAEILQRSLLPDRLPTVPGWSLAAQYRPMAGGDVGGDWYDVVTLDSGEVVCVLGDVAGHGIAAAGTMGQLRNGLRAYLVEDPRPGQVLRRLGRLVEKLLPTAFATATVVVLDPATGKARIASAGHPPVCLVPAEGEALLLPVEPGPPLGVTLGSRPAESTFTVGPGDLLVLYSDGMVERRSESMEVGLARLTRLSTGAADEVGLCTRLIADCRDPAGEDDATVLILRRDHWG